MAVRRRVAGAARRTRRGGRKALTSLRSGLVGESIKGIGGAEIAGVVAGKFAPQYVLPARLVGGFVTGGFKGGAVAAAWTVGISWLMGRLGGAAQAQTPGAVQGRI